MFSKRFKIWPLAIVAAVCLFTTRFASGGYVSGGGWTASWDSSLDDLLGLTLLSNGNNSVSFHEHAQFTTGPGSDGAFDPMVITFQQKSPSAVQFIVIEDGSIVNQTGLDWGGVELMLSPPAAVGVKFDVAKSLASGDRLSIAPFTNVDFSGGGKELYVGDGGVVPAEPIGMNVWNPGQSSGALFIDGSPTGDGPARSFAFLVQPVAIPLPPPAVSAASTAGLLGLGSLLKAWRGRHA